MVQADKAPSPPAPARKDCRASMVEFVVQHRFGSLVGEPDFCRRAVLGERLPLLAG